jgi:hypothetical protein
LPNQKNKRNSAEMPPKIRTQIVWRQSLSKNHKNKLPQVKAITFICPVQNWGIENKNLTSFSLLKLCGG